MITLSNIEKIYRTDTVETLALNNISLDVAKGEFLSIMGPSGCGKSTLLNIIGLLDEPTAGALKIDQQQLNGFSDKALARFRNGKIGFIFQSYHLINDLPVLDNVELPLLYRNVSASERRRLATAALEKVGLSNRMKHYPSQLSGGQKQRVAIARALVSDPKLILADEPTGNLDSENSAVIEKLLFELHDMLGTTLIIVTHDEELAKKCKRVIYLKDGVIAKDSAVSTAKKGVK